MRSVLAVLLAALALAGCASPLPQPGAPEPLARAVADTRPMTWAPGNWWSYHADVANQSLDVTLVVAEPDGEDGFLLGTNVSSGFFGLPFHGNVTRELNPVIGPDEWPLYRFPLADGKSWDYKLLGHDARTTARAAMIDVPGVGPQPGFALEASSFGQVFARYDYSPASGWFTRLELIEPTKGETLLKARLTDFGPDYGGGYYVERALRESVLRYPGVPGALDVDVPSGYARVNVVLAAAAEAGLVDLALKDASGRELAKARVVGKGGAAARLSVEGARSWTLEHAGVGQGYGYLDITGLVKVGDAPEPQGDVPAWSLGAVFEESSPAPAPDVPELGTPIFQLSAVDLGDARPWVPTAKPRP